MNGPDKISEKDRRSCKSSSPFTGAVSERKKFIWSAGRCGIFFWKDPLGKILILYFREMPAGLAKELARQMEGTAFLLDDAFGTWRVVIKKEEGKSEADFCVMQGGDILADLRQRDFTVNSLAIRLPDIFQNGKPLVIDPLGGLSDLRQGILRANSEDSLRQDPLRMLRAYRFAYTLGLKIDEETGKAIGRNRKLIRRSAGERVRGEFFAALHENQAAHLLRDLYQTGLLPELFPEIGEWEQFEPGASFRFSPPGACLSNGGSRGIPPNSSPGFFLPGGPSLWNNISTKFWRKEFHEKPFSNSHAFSMIPANRISADARPGGHRFPLPGPRPGRAADQ